MTPSVPAGHRVVSTPLTDGCLFRMTRLDLQVTRPSVILARTADDGYITTGAITILIIQHIPSEKRCDARLCEAWSLFARFQSFSVVQSGEKVLFEKTCSKIDQACSKVNSKHERRCSCSRAAHGGVSLFGMASRMTA